MSRQIPEGWKAGVLTDYAEINPRLAQRSELEEDTLVSFIRMEDVSNNAIVKNVRIVSYEQVSKGFTTFQDKDVLLAKITPCFENGKGGFVDNLQNGVGFGSTEFHVLRAKENSDPHFIYQVTNYPEFRIKGETNMTGSAGQRRVPTDYLKTFDVVFPPLPEQQKIATILTSVDTVIEKTRAQIDKLKDLKTGMMQELLTQGIGHTEFKNTPVGRIPKAWEIQNINGLVTKVGSGVTPRGGSAAYVSSGVPLIRSQNVYSDGLRLEDVAYITAEQHKKMGNSQLKPNDVLLNITGASIGRCHYLPSDFKEGNVNQHVCIIRPKQSVINSAFLAYLLNSELGQRQIMSLQAGGNREGINFQQIREISFAIPTLPEQQKIVNVLQSIDTKIIAANQKFNSVEQTKKALMQDLLTGNVRI